MNARVTVDAEPEALIIDFIEHTLAELHDVFLLRLIAGGIIEHLAHNAGVARTQHIFFGYSNEIAHLESRHKEIVTV